MFGTWHTRMNEIIPDLKKFMVEYNLDSTKLFFTPQCIKQVS